MRFIPSIGVLVVAGLLGWFALTTNGTGSHYGVKLGLDLAGGTELIYKAETAAVPGDKAGALSSLRDVIDRRVNLFGVAEPLVQLEHSSAVASNQEDRLLVELPGVTDVQEFMVVPFGFKKFSEAIQAGTEIYDSLALGSNKNQSENYLPD